MKNVIGWKHSTGEVCLLSFQAFRPCSWIKPFFFFSFIQRCEQYAEYDAFIWAPEPSNPWISDDITLWEQDKSL